MGCMTTLRGRLLVATPVIEAGPFLRSVVFVLDHDEEGALGVVVNHPLDADVDEVLPQWAGLVNAPDCLFGGGPVGMDSALALGLVGESPPPRGWRPMAGRVGVVDLDGPVPDLGQLAGLRVFAGYAGWSPGQLEGELAEGAWFITEARDSDLVSAHPDRLWRDVLRRQHGDVRFLATFPIDPTVN